MDTYEQYQSLLYDKNKNVVSSCEDEVYCRFLWEKLVVSFARFPRRVLVEWAITLVLKQCLRNSYKMTLQKTSFGIHIHIDRLPL